MSETTLLEQTTERLMTQGCTGEARELVDDSGFQAELWGSLAELGLPWVSVPEEVGGVGGTVDDACSILRIAGRHAAAIPIAETGFLGGWLLASVGFMVPDTPVTVSVDHPDDISKLRRVGSRWVLNCRLHRVPWASRCSHIVVLVSTAREHHVVVLPVGSVDIVAGHNLAGEARDMVIADDVAIDDGAVALAPEGIDREAFRERGALARTIQLVGAMETVATLTLTYANNREQFGRPISQFQAVQHHLVQLASETAGAALAADVAVLGYAAGGGSFEVGMANANARWSAGRVAAHAHQVHGAIGMTLDYDLNLYTRRLWSWRQEFGSERWWSGRLGSELVSLGPDQLWDRVASDLASS